MARNSPCDIGNPACHRIGAAGVAALEQGPEHSHICGSSQLGRRGLSALGHCTGHPRRELDRVAKAVCRDIAAAISAPRFRVETSAVSAPDNTQ